MGVLTVRRTAIATVITVAGVLLIAAMAVALVAPACAAGEPDLEWVKSTGSYVSSGPAFHSNMLYVGTLDGNVYGYMVTLGEPQWPWPVNYRSAIASSLVVGSDRTLYFGTGSGILYAIDSLSSDEKWRFQADANIDTTPVLSNGLLIFGSDSANGTGKVYALNAETGRLEWSVPTGGIVSYGIAAGDNVAYFGSRDGNLYAIDTYSGKARWIVPLDTPNQSKVYSPALADGVIYVGVGDRSVYAVDPQSGNVRWRFSQMDGAVVSKPLCMLGYVYAGSQDGYVYALEAATGKLVWKFRTDGPVKATPLFDASGQAPIVYAGSGDGNVYAIDAKFGLPYWQYRAPGSVDSTPVVISRSGESHLYFVTVNGDVGSLKLPDRLVMGTATPAPTGQPTPTPVPTPKPTPTLVPLPSPTAPAPLSPVAGLAGMAAAVLLMARRRR
ncbi:MAG: outer membrane biogenesis protein BamB [Methanocella sp. PtaU1.Bin125]|nr:MAG: outer membrane biogenesis protein BamB [Methanocella sp. PtaU1.Bin125]